MSLAERPLTAVVMAGGKGTRLGGDVPKPLVPVAGRPILDRILSELAASGVRDVILTLGYKAGLIRDYVGDGSRWGLSVGCHVESSPLGTAGALWELWARRRLDGDFLLLNADSLFRVDWSRFLRFHRERKALATLLTHPNSHPYDSGLIVADDRTRAVTEWLAKEDPRPRWYRNRVNSGLHILNAAIFDCLSASRPAPGQPADLDRDVLRPAIASGRVFAYDSPEYSREMGTPGRLRQVEADLRGGLLAARSLDRPRRAVFLDRDGTINRYVGAVRRPEDFDLLPDAAEAVRRLNNSGYLAIVATNQPVLARGEVTEQGLRAIHDKMETLLGEAGACIDALYYCPHHPDKGFPGEVPALKRDCDCRKPKPGMLLRAASDFSLDLARSWMVGDDERDVLAGRAAGCRTVLLAPPLTLLGAVDQILRQ